MEAVMDNSFEHAAELRETFLGYSFKEITAENAKTFYGKLN